MKLILFSKCFVCGILPVISTAEQGFLNPSKQFIFKTHAQSINKIFNKMHLDLRFTIVVSSFMTEITRIQIKIETENK